MNAVSWQTFVPRAGVRYGDDSGVDEDDVTHIGRIDFRNDKRPFGIKDEDRRFSHLYVIGKTGTGKSMSFIALRQVSGDADGFPPAGPSL